jgi:D-sedoheptulose 7-phosphate isomerase
MIRYYCKHCDGYYTGGVEDADCPVCRRQAQVVPVVAKVGKYSGGKEMYDDLKKVGRSVNLINTFLDDAKLCAFGLKKQALQISEAISILAKAREQKKHVFICGNGGSAGTSTHFAADLFKMGELRAISLVDNIPLNSALINDEGWSEVYTEQLKRMFDEGDVLIALSVHGGTGADKAGIWSQNLLRAIDYVKEHGGKTIGLAGFDGGSMKTMCDVCIVVPANSTPLVEAFHVVLHHLITWQLYEGKRK